MIAVHCAFDEMVPVELVVGNPQNPNIHPKRQIKLLAGMIRARGWRAPITISRLSGFVVRGHGRLEAAKLLDVEAVPVDYQDYMNVADEWADLVADNRIAELAETNDQFLLEIMKALEQVDFDIDLTGYSKTEVERLLTRDDEQAVDDETVHLRTLSRNLGAYHIHYLTEINDRRLKKWKTGRPDPAFDQRMVKDFVRVCEKRPAYFEAVTIPPPSYKRAGYEDYPIDGIAQALSKTVERPFQRIFEPRKAKTKRSVHGRLETGPEVFTIGEKTEIAGSYLVIDDVTTTGRTFFSVQQALEAQLASCFMVAWVQWGH